MLEEVERLEDWAPDAGEETVQLRSRIEDVSHSTSSKEIVQKNPAQNRLVPAESDILLEYRTERCVVASIMAFSTVATSRLESRFQWLFITVLTKRLKSCYIQ